jgi:uncharacterized protein (DUF2147 family)
MRTFSLSSSKVLFSIVAAATLLADINVCAQAPAQRSLPQSADAVSAADRIIGEWVTDDGDAKVEYLAKADGSYYCRLIWMAHPNYRDGSPKLDRMNPDKSLRNKPWIGLTILDDIHYDSETGRWICGYMYHCGLGMTAKGNIEMQGNKIIVRGHKFGITGKQVFYRAK